MVDPQSRAELRRLHDQATPGEWTTDPDVDHQRVLGNDGYMVADCAIISLRKDAPTVERCTANAKLIATSKSALPALLDQLDALERFHDAWTEHQCGLATGDPEIAREKKRALMAAQRAVLETRRTETKGGGGK